MSTAILVICGVMLIVAILVRIRQKKAEEEPQQKKTTKASATKTSKKTATVEAKPEKKVQVKAKKEAKRPQIDIDTLTAKIDVMIADRQFAKAEGMINQTLNQDASHHVLYSKLMNIYVLQHDEFAMNQLLNTVQNQRLNEVYQDLFSRKEAYLEEKANSITTEPSKADTVDYTPSSATNNTVDFDSLNDFASPTQTTNSAPLEFDASSASTTSDSSFDALNLNIDSPSTDNVAPADFDQFNTESQAPISNQNLDFKLDSDTPPSQIEASPSLDFNLDQPSAKTESPNVDFNLGEDSSNTESPLLYEVTQRDQPTEVGFDPSEEIATAEIESSFVDADDPIAQAFPTLAQVDPVELDIELAEQYVRLGEIAAAKQLLNVDQAQLNADQAEKVQQLLQKIA